MRWLREPCLILLYWMTVKFLSACYISKILLILSLHQQATHKPITFILQSSTT